MRRNSTPTSRDGTERPRLVRVEVMKILNEVWVHDVAGRHLRPLFRSITPGDEVLFATTTSMDCQETFNRVHWATFNDPGGMEGVWRQGPKDFPWPVWHVPRGKWGGPSEIWGVGDGPPQGWPLWRWGRGPQNHGTSLRDSILRGTSRVETHSFSPGW